MTDDKKKELAARVFDLADPYEIADSGETIESTLNTLNTQPEYIIEFLLDIIEGLQN